MRAGTLDAPWSARSCPSASASASRSRSPSSAVPSSPARCCATTSTSSAAPAEPRVTTTTTCRRRPPRSSPRRPRRSPRPCSSRRPIRPCPVLDLGDILGPGADRTGRRRVRAAARRPALRPGPGRRRLRPGHAVRGPDTAEDRRASTPPAGSACSRPRRCATSSTRSRCTRPPSPTAPRSTSRSRC